MNVFMSVINLDKIALFKADLIFDIVSEMDLNDKMREELIREIISYLDDTLML